MAQIGAYKKRSDTRAVTGIIDVTIRLRAEQRNIRLKDGGGGIDEQELLNELGIAIGVELLKYVAGSLVSAV